MRNGMPVKGKPKREPLPTNANHDENCYCVPCMVRDMDATIAANGLDVAKYHTPDDTRDTSVRTRYAKPGQKVGRGYVRKLSQKQVRFIKSLLSERDTSRLVRLPGSEDIEDMSLAGARDLIDRLLSCPELPKAAKKTETPATENQLNTLIKMMGLKNANGAPIIAAMGIEKARDGRKDEISFTEAKAAISFLINDAPWLPREAQNKPPTNKSNKPENTSRKEVEKGLYLVDGDVYKVQIAVHGSGKPYAKKLDFQTGKFEYANGAIYNVNFRAPMTKEEAQEIAKKYRSNVELESYCFICGLPLTDETSMDRGIGPICWSKLG